MPTDSKRTANTELARDCKQRRVEKDSTLMVKTKWGCYRQAHVVNGLVIRYRPDTNDVKAIGEVLDGSGCYQLPHALGLRVEASDCWLDLGAQIGSFSLLALSVGGRVVSVEPEKSNLALLHSNLQRNFPDGEYKVIEGGVGLKSGKQDFYLCARTKDTYRHSMFPRNRAHMKEPVKVAVHSLAGLLTKYPRVNAIKMDIEGMEMELLEQAFTAGVCEKLNKLCFEWTFDVDRSMRRFWSVIDFLRAHFSNVHVQRMSELVKMGETCTLRPAATIVCCYSPQRAATQRYCDIGGHYTDACDFYNEHYFDCMHCAAPSDFKDHDPEGYAEWLSA